MSKQIKRMLALLLCLCLCLQYAGALDTTTAGENTSGAQAVTETESTDDSVSDSASAQDTTGTDSESSEPDSDSGETAPDTDLSSSQEDIDSSPVQPDQSTEGADQETNSPSAQDSSSLNIGDAESSTDATTVQEQSPDQQEVSEDESPLLSYVVVNSPQLSAPDTQEILIGIGNESTLLDQAVLTVRNQDTGETTSYDAAELTAGGALFRIDYNAGQSGTYILESIQFVWNSVTYETLFSDTGISALYGVDTSVESTPDAVVVDEDTETTSSDEQADVVFDVTTLDNGGDQELANSVEDALNNADLQNGISTMSLGDAKSGNVVIVLDPGHDASHVGTSSKFNGVTYNEYELTLKIAQYCKDALEQYDGVTVYLTRNSNQCPNGASNATDCNAQRVAYAKSVGADYFVSLHLNSYSDSSVGGAEIYYPNQNYRPDLSADGKGLAQSILDQLVDLGLTDRGVKIRNSEDGTTYEEDGSLADYYGVIRRCKEAGITGIIVEHAFLSGTSDFENFLSSDAKLQKLGEADATGIANYLGLTKDTDDPSNAKLSVTQTASGSLTASLTGVSADIREARFAVWSAENGQDDLVWYTAQRRSDGSMTATIPLSDHSGYGSYYIHCYVQSSSGSQFVAGSALTISKVTGSTSASVTDSVTGSFRVNISKLGSANLISKIQVAVWSNANGQDDLIWTDATKSGDQWYVDVDTYTHNYEQGVYNIHVYVLDIWGGWYCINCISHTVSQQASTPSVSTQWDQAKGQLNLTLKNYLISKNVTSVRFAVWSSNGGQDDLAWYTAKRQSDGTLTASVPLSSHATYGTYYIHCYAYTNSGSQFVAGTATTISKVTGSATAAVTNTTTGSFRVTISGVNVPKAVDEIRIAVWSSANGQDDLIWTKATKNGDQWYLDVDTYDHNYEQGTYYIHTYVQDNMGGWYCISCINHTVTQKASSPSLSTQWNQAKAQLNLTLENYLMGKNITSVRFAVWSEDGGQDDLTWYTARRQSNGSLTATVPLSDHASYGSYIIHCYAYTSSGSQFVAGTATTISKVTGTVSTSTIDSLSGSFRVNLSNVAPMDAVKEVQMAVWTSANGQDDLIWMPATKTSSGWYVNVETSDHNYQSGIYCIHIYVRDTMGGWYAVRCINQTVTVSQNSANLTVAMSSNTDYLDISLTGANLNPQSSVVKFAVWSANNDQDDLIWYTAAYSSGKWVYSVPLSNHRFDTGIYYIHCYYNAGDGDKMLRAASITPYTGARPGNTTTAKTIWNFLISKGMTEAGAAALMGNLFAESGLNSTNLQNSFESSLGYNDASYTTAVDNGSYRYKTYTDVRSSFSRDSAGYGLAQWTYWSRKQALYDYAKSRGTSIGNLNMQLDFLWQELNASYPTVVKALTTATSVKTASDIVLTQFERPADQSTSVKELRANYGRAYYSYFA